MEEYIEQKDLKVGDIVWYGSSYDYLIRVSQLNSVWCDHYINGSRFHTSGGGCSQSKYKVASEREIKWFNKCVEEGKYIPLEDIPKDEIVNDYSIF